jgi:phage minor structural protein
MVLKVFYNDNVYVYKDIDSTFFRTRSYGGMMYLQFDISTDHKLYKFLAEEIRVEYDNQYYLIKGINERTKSKVSTINCELDLTGLESKIYTSITFNTESFYNVCKEILASTGWTIVDAELVSKRTTLEITDNTPREILDTCTNSTAYNTCYEFDTKNKIIYCIKPLNNTTPTGTYFTDELNLSELTFKGSSSSLITKLYAYGKDGLSIASVNGGKEYIENYSYTNKVVADVWRDERYTDAQSLYDDAVVKLATLAVPERSYTCKVIDLAKTNPETYGKLLTYDLYDVVTLIDRNRQTRIDHRIVEVKEYPANHTLDTVTLSTIAGRVTGKITTLADKLTQLDAQQLHDRTKVNEIKQDLDSTVLHVSESWASSVNESLFTQTAEGLFLQVDKVVGTNRWSTLLQQSATDVQISWNKISNYIKFENSQLNIYNSSNTKIMSLNSGGQNIYDSSGTLLMSLNAVAQNFYYKGTAVGHIGTGAYEENDSIRGLVFHLENDAGYMAWAWKEKSTNEVYLLKLAYTAKKLGDYSAGQLHTGCDLNLHNHYLRNATLKDWGFEDGSISDTFSGYYATSKGESATRRFSLTFNKGILQKAEW